MPRPRRDRLFPLDARVLDAGAWLVTRERPHFFGLEVARLLDRERSTVYKSLHRLVDLGLLTDEWDGGRRYYQLTDFGQRSVVRALLGARVFGRTDDRLRRVRAMTRATSEFTARRVVTGHDAEGRAVIVSDGEPAEHDPRQRLRRGHVVVARRSADDSRRRRRRARGRRSAWSRRRAAARCASSASPAPARAAATGSASRATTPTSPACTPPTPSTSWWSSTAASCSGSTTVSTSSGPATS